MADARRSKKKVDDVSVDGPRPIRRGAPRAGAADAKAEPDGVDGLEAPTPESPSSPVCPVAFCPVGMALSTVQGAGPEVIDHLLSAAREFLMAARAVVNARADGLERGETRTLQRIEIG